MKYDIIHELPGRMRVHCRNLSLEPSTRIELTRWVSEHDALVSAKLSARTGNLLVVYSRSASRENILVILDDLKLFGVANVIPQDEKPIAVTVCGVVAAQCGREAMHFAMEKALPATALQAISGWKIASRLMHLFGLLVDGKIAEFCWGAAKFALFAAFGKYISVRFALSLVGALVDAALFTPAATRDGQSHRHAYGRQLPLITGAQSAMNDVAIPFAAPELPFHGFSGRCALQ